MIVRHDTSALDRVMAAGAANQEMPSQRARAVEATVATMVDGQASVERTRAQGEAHARRWAGNGRFAVLAGAGIAIAAVGIGLGIWLARPPAQDVPVVEAPAAVPPAIAAGEHADPLAPVVTNFVLFRQITAQRAGRNWVIEAGHQFDSANDTEWSKAWCYSTPSAAGVAYHLELADRASPDGPVGLVELSTELREKLALDDATFDELAAACPWLDGGSASAMKV